MPDDRVTLVVWRDASTDPPREGEWRLTDRGWLRYTDLYEGYEDPSPPGTPLWCEEGCGEYLWVSPQPTVWCDPKPPGENAVTLDDLRRARHLLDTEMWHDEAARLRAALDAVSAEEEAS